VSARFIDSNVFLRHLLNDHPTHSSAALALFRAIERREAEGWTSALVVSELVFVLAGRLYQVPRATIRDQLLPLLSLPGLKLERKRMYTRVFELFTTLNIDYNDCYHAALIEARREVELWSFDEDFDRIPGLKRQTPSGAFGQ
jgi:predicted nucleic acid-binding protein